MLVFASSVAAAQSIDGRTSCAVAIRAFDDENKPLAREIVLFIRGVFDRLDANHTNHGERSALAPLTDEGLGKIVIAAVEFCREHPAATIYGQAVNAYRGLRSLQETLGVGR